MSSAKSEKKGGITSKIICKYFIQDKCTKGDACPYLHSKVEKPKEILQIECPMYNIGFCKNGRNCHFLHIKKDKYVEDNSDEKNPNSSPNHIKEEEEIKENNSTNESNKEEEKNFPEIPIWYLEHYYDKPLPLIFSELEQKNLPEINELKIKYGFTNIQPNLPAFPLLNKKNKMNLNMNTLNLNFNNFNMNYAFNNNKTDIIQNSYQINQLGQNMQDRKYDKYELKKNKIERLLKKSENVFYYLIRCKTFDEVKKSQESNFIGLPEEISEKYKEENQNNIIILIIVDDENLNFSGFAQLIMPLSKEEKKGEETLYKIEWQWKTKLCLLKISHLKNKIDNDNYLIDGKNGCEIDKELGFICCRYLMKRLSKDEVKVFMNDKKDFENEKNSIENLKHDNNNKNINKNSNKVLNKVNKKYEKYELNSPFKGYNGKRDMSNTNSTRYSDYKKNEKEIEYKYSGRKRYRDNSKSKSRSRSKDKKRRDHSEDYSPYYKNKNSKYEDKHYHNSNDYNSNKKFHINSRNNKDYKDNNLHYRHKYSDHKNDYSNRKYHY